MSDHQIIFCTRKTKKDKVGGHKQISFRSFKNCSIEMSTEKSWAKLHSQTMRSIKRYFSEDDCGG